MASENQQALSTIKNFHSYSVNFSSSGMPTNEQWPLVKSGGYQHIINLIPGDFSSEELKISSLGMTFNQIAVVWDKPTLKNFQDFIDVMSSYPKQNKVLLHCQLNYRASTFAYLYRVTQLRTNPKIAKEEMLKVWQPVDTWQYFINSVLLHYKKVNKNK